MAAINPKPMAIILLFSAAVLSISTAAITSMPPSAPPKSVEACVKLLFDPPRRPPPSMRRILCGDLLRTVVKSFRVTGKLSPEYVAALKKLPKFQNNPEALHRLLCGLSPSHASGCDKTLILPSL